MVSALGACVSIRPAPPPGHPIPQGATNPQGSPRPIPQGATNLQGALRVARHRLVQRRDPSGGVPVDAIGATATGTHARHGARDNAAGAEGAGDAAVPALIGNAVGPPTPTLTEPTESLKEDFLFKEKIFHKSAATCE
ncbi:unnamed protein product [Lampetra fluviatilis]